MNRAPITVLVGGFLVSACATVAVPPTPGFDAALDLVTRDRLEAHVAYLADDRLEGRESGQPGFDLAAAYVAAQFTALGMEPGGTDGWYQPVPLQSRELDTDSTRFVLHRDAGDVVLEYRRAYSMSSGDKVRAETSVSGEVVYVGYGIHAPELGYSDYEGIDVTGKIIAYFSGGPDSMPGDERAYYSSGDVRSEEAIRRGAIGEIGLQSRRSQESSPWERVERTTGRKPGMSWIDPDSGAANSYYPELRVSSYVSPAAAELLFADAPLSFADALDAAAESRVASAPLGISVSMARKTRHEQLLSPNVIGIVRGSDPALADEYVVFTAHLDHAGIGEPEEGSDDRIYNGAYDNAVGVAAMIEAARAIAANPPRRSVMFIALAAEEFGLLGSDYFVHYPTVPIDAIVANVNLDMPLFLFPVRDLVDFGAAHSSMKEPMTAAAAAEGFQIVPDPQPEENLFRRTDQYSFVKMGVPSSYLDTGFGSMDPAIDGEAVIRQHRRSHYHRPSDDMSRPFHWDSIRRFARANARVGFLVGNADGRPTWNEGDFFGDRFARDRVETAAVSGD